MSEQQPAMFVYKLKFILFPQPIATLNYWLWIPYSLISTGLFSKVHCNDHVNPQLLMVSMVGSTLAMETWHYSVSTCLSRPCSVIILTYCGYMHVGPITTLNAAICVVQLILFSCFHCSPHLSHPFHPPLIYRMLAQD